MFFFSYKVNPGNKSAMRVKETFFSVSGAKKRGRALMRGGLDQKNTVFNMLSPNRFPFYKKIEESCVMTQMIAKYSIESK